MLYHTSPYFLTEFTSTQWDWDYQRYEYYCSVADRVNDAIWGKIDTKSFKFGPSSNKPIKSSTCQITKQNVWVSSTSNHNSVSEEGFRSYIRYTRSFRRVATFDSTITDPQRNFFVQLQGITDYPIQEVAEVKLLAENDIQMHSVLHEPTGSVEI